jgi:hypothetical protein
MNTQEVCMFNTHYSTGQKKPVKVDERVIGYLLNGTFYKSVIGSKHRLRHPPAYAVDAEVFDSEIKPNASEIVVIDRETGIEYHVSVVAFDRFKEELDRGFGRQYYLTLSYWQVRGSGHTQLGFWEEGNV